VFLLCSACRSNESPYKKTIGVKFYYQPLSKLYLSIIYIRMNTGSSNRLIYDRCAYDKELAESVAPLNYRMYSGAHENCNKCIYTKFYRPFDLVEQESELKNITRPATKCPSFKYQLY
jgi:hypothetical protein